MKLSEFIVLAQDEKKITLLHEGVAIAKRQDFNHAIFLFQLRDYYVEAYCCTESKEIQEYRVFHNLDYLSPYLDAIKIDNLLN